MDYKITNKAIDKLKYDLVREGLLDYNQLVDAIDLSRNEQTNLGQILIQNNIINEEKLLNFLEKKLHIPYVNLDEYTIDSSSIGLISSEEATKYRIIPLFKIEDTLTIAMSDPLDLFALNNLDISSNYKVEPVICSERSISHAINYYYKTKSANSDNIEPTKKGPEKPKFDWQSELNDDNTDEVNVYRLVRAIIYQAIHENASEIHMDPQQDEMIVRFRIDGLLYSRGSLPILLAPEPISRIKSAAGLDINEEYLPQHGRLEVNIGKDIINARVSTYPINYGEKIVIKIFPKAPNIELLGLYNDQLKLLKSGISKENGLVIAAGPLGSGQTTTMYSILESINSEQKNIMTIESPIRYNIDKINQSQLSISKSFDIETALKNVFLQEPDILYIDEITNLDNLDLIVKSILSGQLIITSIIADSATNILYRLLEYGIEPKLICKIVNATFDQKLIRKLCNKCKIEHKIDNRLIEKYNLPENITYFKEKGCKDCNSTGFKSRTGIFEVFYMDDTTINLFNDGIPEDELNTFLKSSGHKTLLDIALNKVISGFTSFTEIQKVFKL
ncbi:MAG: ATPase, T2SS/T4P/T4SS family [Cyanobacteriota bacterium]